MSLPRHYFLVTSTGCAATRWLAATLNRHPEIVCSGGAGPLGEVMAYGARPDAGQVDRIAASLLTGAIAGAAPTLDSMFQELEDYRDVRFVGNVHRETVSSLHRLTRLHPTARRFQVANIIRHPVPRTETKFNNELFNHAASPRARELCDVQYRARTNAFPSLIEALLRRLGAFDTDVHRRLFVSSLLDTVEGAADFLPRSSPYSIPHFKMEDIKADPARFLALVRHLTDGQLELSPVFLESAFSAANLNAERFRTDRLAAEPPRDARSQWNSWEDWKRTAFRIAMECTGFHHAFVEHGYPFDFASRRSWSGCSWTDLHPPRAAEDAQMERIRAAVTPGRPSIVFFCPGRLFRRQFGRIPALLESRGCTVLYLHGEKHGGEFESHATSFHIWGDMSRRLDFIDIFAVPTTMDALPPAATKILFQHNSFAEVSFSNQVSAAPAGDPYSTLVNQHAHFRAFLPLFDYVVAATPLMAEFMDSEMRFFGRRRSGSRKDSGPRSTDADGLLDGLHGQRIPRRQCVIPCGYPPLDATLRAAQASPVPEPVITYAPTLLTGKLGWEPYASVRLHGKQIMLALLDAFPGHQVVFKPCDTEDSQVVNEIVEACSGRRNFVLDSSASQYQQLYTRTQVLVSDFSSTAYTFAFSTLRPVVFFSHNEAGLPPEVRDGPFGRHRTGVGSVAVNCCELVQAVRESIEGLQGWADPIRRLRDELIYNPGSCEERFVEAFDAIVSGRDQSGWHYFEWDESDPAGNPGIGPGMVSNPWPVLLGDIHPRFDIVAFANRLHALSRDAGSVSLADLTPAEREELSQSGRYHQADDLVALLGMLPPAAQKSP